MKQLRDKFLFPTQKKFWKQKAAMFNYLIEMDKAETDGVKSDQKQPNRENVCS